MNILLTIFIAAVIFLGLVPVIFIYITKKPEPKPVPSKFQGCDIEYMPKTKRYYPRVQGDYLWRRYASGVLERSSSIAYCEFGRTKQEALDMLEEYLETQGKGSQILEV